MPPPGGMATPAGTQFLGPRLVNTQTACRQVQTSNRQLNNYNCQIRVRYLNSDDKP